MKPVSSLRKDGLNEYTYQRSLREGFANQSLVIYTNQNNIIVSIKANSAATGVAVWSKDAGMVECRSWEGEEAAGSHGDLSKHFPAEVLGEQGDSALAEKIMVECLSFMDDSLSAGKFSDFCRDTSQDIFFTAGELTDAPDTSAPPAPESPKVRRKLKLDGGSGDLYTE